MILKAKRILNLLDLWQRAERKASKEGPQEKRALAVVRRVHQANGQNKHSKGGEQNKSL